jgi:hypothetical protein
LYRSSLLLGLFLASSLTLDLTGLGGPARSLSSRRHRQNRRIVGRVVFNVARVLSRKVGDSFFPELLVNMDPDGISILLAIGAFKQAVTARCISGNSPIQEAEKQVISQARHLDQGHL